MVPESLRVVVMRVAMTPLALLGGCSLALDFSDTAIPLDAGLDAVSTQDQCDYKEPNDSVVAPALFATTETGPAAICPIEGGTEDHDFYKFSVPSGTASVQIKIDFVNRELGDLELRLFDVTGATMYSQSRGFTDQELITCPASSPPCPVLEVGDYVFEVFPAKMGVVNTYTPTLTITPI